MSFSDVEHFAEAWRSRSGVVCKIIKTFWLLQVLNRPPPPTDLVNKVVLVPTEVVVDRNILWGMLDVPQLPKRIATQHATSLHCLQ